MAGPRFEVLVIDDELQLHRVLQPLLEAGGYQVTRALTGAEGLACLSQRAPDVMVLDLGLPDRAAKPSCRMSEDCIRGLS